MSNSDQRRDRGRPVGLPTQKRKSEDELSNNPHTKRSRTRMENMLPNDQRVEKAKNALRKQKMRKLKNLRDSDEYKQTSPAVQKSMEIQLEDSIDQEYMANGKHPDVIAEQLGHQVSDRPVFENPEDGWEDIPENQLSEYDLIMLAAHTAAANGETLELDVPEVGPTGHGNAIQDFLAATEASYTKAAYLDILTKVIKSLSTLWQKISLLQTHPTGCMKIWKEIQALDPRNAWPGFYYKLHIGATSKY
ncbi:unnamed protein product [Clonostachys rhizophaga]|uniref:Uncharacterized protein n=1 Tax=Clonostachys rhizophaga TaxID=160324 RepID=A0A9N9YJY8_9HYPO|nr:unnamed protein product [Clonostachys rhizophaga]